MRLQNKIALIGLLASTALIGTGYAAWTFTNAAQTNDAEATQQIVCAVELNDDFKLYNAADHSEISSLYLICDAPSTNINTLGGHGVYWSTTNDTTSWANKIDNVYIKGTLTYDKNDIAELASVTVTFANGEDYALDEGTYIDFTDATIPNLVVTIPSDSANNVEVNSGNFALPTPSYKEAVNSFTSVTEVNGITDGLVDLVIAYQVQITDETLA